MYLDDNLEQTGDGSVICRHCGTLLGEARHPLRDSRIRERPAQEAGPGVRAEAHHFTDRQVILRQSFCPQCLVLLQAEIVPADEPPSRTRSLEVRL